MNVVSAHMFAVYPARCQLLSMKGEGPSSKPLLVRSVVTGLLLPDLWRNAQWQISGFGGDPAQRYFWLGSILFHLILTGAGFLKAIKRPGWQMLGVLLGLIYLYLGVAAITLPNEVGSWGTIGGILSLIVGAALSVANPFGSASGGK